MTDSKWDRTDALLRQPNRGSAVGVPNAPFAPLEPIDGEIAKIREEKIGLIGNFKKNKITRNAALEKLKAMHDAQIESAKHALRRAVDVDKQRIDLVANKFIFQLTEEYLKDMRDLGLKNFESRMTTLLQLNETASRLLEQASTQDVPPTIKEATVQNIFKKFIEFSDRLMEEETKLSQ
jgi:hypothetical protein